MRRIAIGARPNSRGELAGWYATILEQQAESGLSVAEFAARSGLSAWTLYQWRRRLLSLDSDQATKAPRLIEVAVARQVSADAAGILVVRLGDGRRSIAVPAGFDSDELRRLMAVLESC
jgi:hypothetical protein